MRTFNIYFATEGSSSSIYFMVMCRQTAREICGEPSTECSSAAVQRPWVEATGTLPRVPVLWHPPMLVIAV